MVEAKKIQPYYNLYSYKYSYIHLSNYIKNLTKLDRVMAILLNIDQHDFHKIALLQLLKNELIRKYIQIEIIIFTFFIIK